MLDNKNIRDDILQFYKADQLIQDNEKLGFNHQTLSERIYNNIKKKIIYHDLKPGQKLIAFKLADELGVSSSLVRQIFNILEKSGQVELIPRKGFYVKEISKQDIIEIYDIRNNLETQATLISIKNISKKELKKVEAIFEEAKIDLYTKDEVKSFIKADRVFNEILIKNSGNNRLIQLINRYMNCYIFYRITDLSRIKRAKQAYFEEYRIFKAVQNRDSKKAAKLISNHIRNEKNIILKNFDFFKIQ